MKSISLPSDSAPAPTQTNLSIGDRVITPTGRTGRILPPKADLPQYHLIQFESGAVLWMLKEILQPDPIKSATPTKKRRKPA